MKERTALGDAIPKHWRAHCPKMVREMEKQKRLDLAVFETQSQTGDLLYELVAVQKIAVSVGAGDAGMGVPAARGPPSPGPSLVPDIGQEPATPAPPAQDFRIKDAHRIGTGRQRKYARNPRPHPDLV